MKRISALLLSVFLLLIISSGSPCLALEKNEIEIYDVMPVYFANVQDTMNAFRSLYGHICMPDGGKPEKIGVDSSGITFSVSGGATTNIPFGDLKAMVVLHARGQGKTNFPWAVISQISEKGSNVVIGVQNRESAEKLISVIASFAAAAGHPVDFNNIGANTVEPKPQDMKSNGLTETKGGVVQYVLIGGVSEKAGLRAGDLILSINGLEVDSNTKFQKEVWPTIWPSAGVYDLEILRKGVPMSIRVEARSADSMPTPPPSLAFGKQQQEKQDQRPQMGFSIREMSESEIASSNGARGAVVAKIEAGGEAEKAGLLAGDLIISCNGNSLTDAASLATLLKKGENVFTVIRNGQKKTISINPIVAAF